MSIRDLFVEIGMDIDDGPLGDLDKKIDAVMKAVTKMDFSGFDDLGNDVDDLSGDFNDLGEIVWSVDKKLNNFDDGNIKEISKSANEAEVSFGKLKVGIIAAGAALASIAVAGGAAVISTAMEMDTAFSRLEAQTGATGAELKGLEDAAKDVFRSGFGENMDEVTDALARVKQNIQNIDDSELSKVTSNAMMLATTFDSDVNEVTRGTNNMMEAFGITSEKAFDLFTAGGQRGLNFSNEMFDNVAEYSSLFGNMGYSAEEYFGIMERGSKAGVYNLDYVNDVMKEFQIRVKDGSKSTDETFSAMSKSTFDLWESFNRGEATVADVASAVTNELQGMDDQVEANQLAVALFGTKWEDLEADAMYAMLGSKDAMEDFEGATGRASDALQDNFGTRLKKVWRDLQIGMIEAFQNEKVQDFLDSIMTGIEAIVPFLKDGFVVFADVIMVVVDKLSIVKDFLSAVKDTISSLMDGTGNISDIWQNLGIPPEIADNIASFAETLVTNFTTVKEAVSDFVENVIVPLMPKAQEIIGVAFDFIGNIVSGAMNVFETISGIIRGLIENVIVPLFPVAQEVISVAMDIISPILRVVGSLFEGITAVVKFLVNEVIVPLFPLAVGAIEGAWAILKPILKAITKAFNAVADAVEWVIEKVGAAAEAISNFSVGDALSGAAKWVGGLIPGFEIGLGRVPFDEMPALLHKNEAVLPADEADKLRDRGILQGDGTRPEINLDQATQFEPAKDYSTTETVNNNTSNNSKVSAPIQIIVQGSDNPQQTAYSVKDALEELFGDLLRVMPVPREG
ncbi:phage tail tape measure protein [Lysinibacillus sp. NPDC093692]|uniref:phage tail tape measure protein n=1 Tax=Lysinibacillus sp. NPDC093692 TaxID=3390578 RepID=UPI003D073A45